jgi:hypothetical protein
MKRILFFLLSFPICAVAQINQAPVVSNLTLVDYRANTLESTFNVKNVIKGLYFIEVKTNQQKSSFHKVIIH